MANEILFGINEVAKRLERCDDSVHAVIVCHGDLKPQQLANHLPALCHRHKNVHLIACKSVGVEAQLSHGAGMRRVAAMAITRECTDTALLQLIKDCVPVC